MNQRLSLAVLLVGLGVCQPALAQTPPPTHKADALFNAGRNLLDAGEYAEACPKFAEANAIAPGLGVTLYLADCYERLGKTASALVWFRRATELARDRKDKRESIAAGRADALVARVPKLVVNVSAEAQAQHVSIQEDGAPLVATSWGASVATDPGDHVLDITADGKAARHVQFHLAPSADTHTETVAALDDPPREPVAVVEPVIVQAVPAAPPPRRDRTLLAVAIASASVGVVGLGVGTAMGLVASSKLSDSNNGPCNSSNHCTSAGLALRSDAEQAGTISTIAFVAGGAAVAAGVVVFLVRPKNGAASASVTVSPTLGLNGGGLVVGGAF